MQDVADTALDSLELLGEHFGERGMIEHTFSLYRPILHVPLIVRVPGKIDGGKTRDDPVRIEDLFPTILEMMGVDPVEGRDGKSLLGGGGE